MPSYGLVPVAKLLPPRNPQRQETLYLRIDEMREDMRKHGQRQNIGVQKEDGDFRIIWGHRRSICATQLQWDFLHSKIFEEDEPVDHDEEMGGENYHRQQTNDIEEARYYERILGKYPDGTIGIARELNVPQSRVESLLATLRGNPAVVDALASGNISLAQASEINKFNTAGYQAHALEMAVEEGKSAESLRRWRIDVQRNLQDQPGTQDEPAWNTPIPNAPTAPTDLCNIGNHNVLLPDRKYYSICTQHWNVILEGMEYWGMMDTIKKAGMWVDFMRLVHKARVVEEQLNGGNTMAGPQDSN